MTLATLTGFPGPAGAFFQTTKVEGALGADLAGVWLAVYHTAPIFRGRITRSLEGVSPIEVAPVPDDMKLLLGGELPGVIITSVNGGKGSGAPGIFVGDVITKINNEPITDIASYNKALAESERRWFLAGILRTSLKRTEVRVVKIRYEVKEAAADGASSIGEELLAIHVSDGVLPFASVLDEAAKSNELYIPTAEDVSSLKAEWYQLSPPERPVFISGDHRVVSANDYDLALRQDTALEGTQFAIISSLNGNPMTGGGTTIAVHGVRKAADGEIAGSYVQSTLASAPFPISIEFGGAFRMTRFEPYSDKDVEHRRKQIGEVKETEEDWKDLELAPDIPDNLEAQ